MERFINKLVVITLETGVGIEGVPTVWTDEEVVVTYPDNDNYTVIFNPSENIIMVSVFADLEKHDAGVEYASDLVAAGESNPGYDRIVEPPDPELDHFEPDPELRALKLGELHVKKTEAIREQLSKHFKNRVASTPQAPVYDTPNFQK